MSTDELSLRPAFIPFPWTSISVETYISVWGDIRLASEYWRQRGYIWQPATESTMAGWVLPKGRAEPSPFDVWFEELLVGMFES